MMVKGRMMWVCPEIIEEVTKIMNEKELKGRYARANAMKELADAAKLGRELDKLMKRMNIWRL